MTGYKNDRVQLIDADDVCHAHIKAAVEQEAPAFIARIGGSDADAAVEYYDVFTAQGPEAALTRAIEGFGIVKLFNGFYDRSSHPTEDDPAKIERFCRLLTDCYRACSDLFVVGAPWLTEFFPDNINPVFQVDTTDVRAKLHKIIDAIAASQNQVRLYPYSFVERLTLGRHTLFHVLSETLGGRRVLVVTPFAESIKVNFHRRHAFFPNYKYPNFDLVTYNTPITYHGLPSEFYPDEDWFATLERIKQEVACLDFDVALLSCGSYAMPLGLFIRDVMRRKAIYVGGCLQLYFGIMGRRYNNPFFIDQINTSAFILPVERERFLAHVKINPETAREAFGAYF